MATERRAITSSAAAWRAAAASRLPGLTDLELAGVLVGLPDAPGYSVTVKPLRYRFRPHLAAYTSFVERTITIQVPMPFVPFGEVVNYGARRRSGRGFRFTWLSEGVTFRTPRDVIRFLYCHEWMHWYLRECLGRRGGQETACDRFALFNYLRPRVDEDDARSALARGAASATQR
jgi:hypothetical protein